ncbi:MAG: hypothetical protein ACU833_14180 [Gammaproteobacteria bacterium]
MLQKIIFLSLEMAAQAVTQFWKQRFPDFFFDESGARKTTESHFLRSSIRCKFSLLKSVDSTTQQDDDPVIANGRLEGPLSQ